MPGVDFKAVRVMVPLLHVLSFLSWRPSWSRGKCMRGWCPIHSSEAHSSRIFAVEGDSWYCHKCRRGGDAIDLYASCKGLSLWRAAVELCELSGLKPPFLPGDGIWCRRPRNRKRNGSGGAGGLPPGTSS
jgi:hypothetical protein